MGTSMRVEAYGGTPALRQQAADEAFAAIAEVDRLMSDYRADSELALLNRDAAARAVAVSPPVFAVLDAADHVSRLSRGAFDVTTGPLAALWGVKDHHPRIPTPAELAAVRPLVDYRNVLLDRQARTVRFTRENVALDLGGIAKGFASEVAAGSLTRRGLAGVVDAGGSQFMVGLPLGKRSWSIGIGDPDRPTRVLGAVETGGGAVATASDPPGTVAASHPLDPRSLQPATGALSATVVSPDGTLCDALSRAALVLGPDEGLALLSRFPDTWGVMAYRQADGGVGVRVTAGRETAFHPLVGR